MRLLWCIPLPLCLACGPLVLKVKGGTQSTAETRSDVNLTIRIDISGCLDLPPEDRLACIKEVTESVKDLQNAAKILYCAGTDQNAAGGKGANSAVRCWDPSTIQVN